MRAIAEKLQECAQAFSGMAASAAKLVAALRQLLGQPTAPDRGSFKTPERGSFKTKGADRG